MRSFVATVAVVAVAAAVLAGAGCGAGADEPAAQPRPVTVMMLDEAEPGRAARRTGVARAWKQQQVGFDVAGRVAWVIEEGSEVEPPVHHRQGEKVRDGTIIAKLDRRRYQLQLNQAQAAVGSVQARLEAGRIELEQVLPRKLEEAQAEADLAARERQRFAALLEQEATTQARFDEVDARARATQARVEQLHARREAARADMLSLEARHAEAREALEQARADLADTTLRAPFAGRIAKVHTDVGGFISPGQPVVSLVMMDPIEVELAVSPAIDRQVNHGDELSVMAAGIDEPLRGVVHRKDTIADPATRTFTLTALLRNVRIATDVWTADQLERMLEEPLLSRPRFNEALAELMEDEDLAERIRERSIHDQQLNRELIERILTDAALRQRLTRAAEDLPAIGGHTRLQRADAARTDQPADFIDARTLYQDEQGKAYTWRIANLRHGEAHKPLLVLEQVEVEPADEAPYPIAARPHHRLADRGRLRDDDLLAIDVPEAELDESGHLVTMIRRRWLLRPGEPVPIVLEVDRAPRGLYAPISAIVADRDGHHVFIVEDDEGDEPARARRVAVRVLDGHGEFKRIEAVEAGDENAPGTGGGGDDHGLGPGVKLIVKGAHYLVDGEPVAIVGREEPLP